MLARAKSQDSLPHHLDTEVMREAVECADVRFGSITDARSACLTGCTASEADAAARRRRTPAVRRLARLASEETILA